MQNNINLKIFNGWNTAKASYVDAGKKLIFPWPTMRLNPGFSGPTYNWRNTNEGIQRPMFDAEYRLPAPVISSLAPDTVIVSGNSFTITINGANFSMHSLIMWGNDALPVTAWNSNQITATVPGHLVTAPGIVSVSVITPAKYGGGGPSNTLAFYIILASDFNNVGGRNTVMVYPNPAKDELTIAYVFTEPCKMEMDLYDLNGQVVKELSKGDYIKGNGTIIVDVSNLLQGLYQLIINTARGGMSGKIAIMR